MKQTIIGVQLAFLLILTGCQSKGGLTATPTTRPTALTPTPEPALSNMRLSQDVALQASLPDVLLDVELSYSGHMMQVRQLVDLYNGSSVAWDEVVFNVPVGSVPGAFNIERVIAGVGSSIAEVSAEIEPGGTVLRVPLPRAVQPGEGVEITMHYVINVPEINHEDYQPVGVTGWNDRVLQAGEWYPALVPFSDSEGWHTWEYIPLGDPTVYPLANYRLRIKSDEEIILVSGGVRMGSEPGLWDFEIPAARGIAFLASPEYEVVTGEANGIPVESYFLPEHRKAGETALAYAINAVTLYEELYGLYPYDSLMLAENAFLGAMEYSSLITLTPYCYAQYTENEASNCLDLLVAHEVAHQWWYGAVGNDQVREPWLDESLAYYSEKFYLERHAPDDLQPWWDTNISRILYPDSPIDGTIYDYESLETPSTYVYPHYGYFIEQLRGQMGDEAFMTFLRGYYSTYKGRLATTEEFKSMAQHHSPVDLTPLFQVFFSPTAAAP